jgi:hypothetical protein
MRCAWWLLLAGWSHERRAASAARRRRQLARRDRPGSTAALNAKRGPPPYALLDRRRRLGPHAGDVALGYVSDLAGGEEVDHAVADMGRRSTASLSACPPARGLQPSCAGATLPEHLAPAAAAMAGVPSAVACSAPLAPRALRHPG